jgi:hypothetical protein
MHGQLCHAYARAPHHAAVLLDLVRIHCSCKTHTSCNSSICKVISSHTHVCMRVQVRSGLRHGGFIRAVEAWWGPVVGAEPLPDKYDGPLHAVKLTFSDKTEPVVSVLV